MNKCKIRILIEPKKLQKHEKLKTFLKLYGFNFYIYDPVKNLREPEWSDTRIGENDLYECIYNGNIPKAQFFTNILEKKYILKSVTIELS